MLDEEDEAEEQRIGVEEGAEAAHHCLAFGPGAVRRRLQLLELPGEAAEPGGEELPDQRVLAGVVAVHGAFRQAGRRGDLADASGADAALHEEPQRRRLDPRPCRLAVAHVRP